MEIVERRDLYTLLERERSLAILRDERVSAKELLMKIKPKIIKNYSNEVPDYCINDKDDFNPNLSAGDEFIDLYLLLKGNLKGKKILDLGCGSSDSEDHKVSRYFDYSPWLCRLLYEAGANPIGIDIQGNEKEKFENYTRDLYKENSLDLLPFNSIDVVTTNALLDSPRLEKEHGRNAGITLLDRIIPQLNRIAKPQGIFIYPNYSVEMLKQSEKRRMNKDDN